MIGPNGDWKGSPRDEISGFSIDSRKISSGDLFVAVTAERDGHEFLSSAEKNGASAGLVHKLRLGCTFASTISQRFSSSIS